MGLEGRWLEPIQAELQAIVPTLVEHFEADLKRLDTRRRIELLAAQGEKLLRSFSGWLDRFLKWFDEPADSAAIASPSRGHVLVKAIGGFAKWWGDVEKAALPPAPGYASFLVQEGVSPVVASLLARIAVRHGSQVAAERGRVRAVGDALRFLAKPGRREKAFARKIDVLLAAGRQTSILETIMKESELSSHDFVEALEAAVKGDVAARQRVRAIVAAIAPLLKVPRGRRVSAASAAHEFFLQGASDLSLTRAYTWSSIEDRCVDRATEAARLEFGDRDFDSRPACRRRAKKAKVS